MENASKVKKGRTVSGFTKAGAKDSHWYQLKNNRRHLVSFTLKSSYLSNDSDVNYSTYKGYTRNYTYSIFNRSGKLVKSVKTKTVSKKVPKVKIYRTTVEKKTVTLKKGTYFVKVKCNVRSPFGSYSLKWK